MTNKSEKLGSFLVLGHHDLDGIVAAAVAGAYLKDKHPETKFSFGTVDFDIKEKWSRFWSDLEKGKYPRFSDNAEELPDGVAIVDFPATWIPEDRHFFYADHHKGSVSIEEIGAKAAIALDNRMDRGEDIYFDGDCGSCAILLATELEKTGWRLPSNLREAVEIAHVVDTAAYDSPSDALSFDSGGAANMDLLTLAMPSREAGRVISDLVDGERLQEALLETHSELNMDVVIGAHYASRLYEAQRQPVSRDTVMLDFTSLEGIEMQRVKFAEFKDPNARYAVQLIPKHEEDGTVDIRGILGRSPWGKTLPEGFAHPDLGKIARQFGGGGGHTYAAGFVVKGRTLKQAAAQARALARIMVSHMRPLSPEHPLADPISVVGEQAGYEKGQKTDRDCQKRRV